MIVLNSKQTYFDENGRPLSGGRLRFFAFGGTTTPVVVYGNSDYSTAIGTSVDLASPGWAETEVYANQSVTVLAEKLIGIDPYGAYLYEVVNQFDVVIGASSGSSTIASVDTIEELRQVIPSDGATQSVNAYFELGDCFVRAYRYDASSTATDNGGTVIASDVDSVGRWLLDIDGPYVDSRIFGFVTGTNPTTSNASFANLLSYCSSVNKVAYFAKGSYYLLSGGSITASCRIKADKGVLINSESGAYSITVTNPGLDIASTFAGTGVVLLLNGNSWNETTVPYSAWNAGAGFCLGNAVFNARFAESVTATLEQDSTFNKIIIDTGVVVSVNDAATLSCQSVEGTGLFRPLNTSPRIKADVLRISNLYDNAYVYSSMLETVDKLVVDRDATIDATITISAFVEGVGSVLSVASGRVVTMSGGYGGSANTFDGDGAWNTGYNSVDADYFANANNFVRSYNASTSSPAVLDMKGQVSTEVLTRSGVIRNGTLGGVNCSDPRLYNCTINGAVVTTAPQMTDCIVIGSMTGHTSSYMEHCNIASSIAVSAYGATWIDTTFNSSCIYCTGGNAVLRNVSCYSANLYPASDLTFSGFEWIGGYASNITFNAYMGSSDGYSTVSNVTIERVKGLSSNINVYPTPGSTGSKLWATDGHYNVRVGNNGNASTRRTFGNFVGYTAVGDMMSPSIYISNFPLLLFGKTDGVSLAKASCSAISGSGPVIVWAMPFAKSDKTSCLLTSDYLGRTSITASIVSGTYPKDNAPVNFNLEVYV